MVDYFSPISPRCFHYWTSTMLAEEDIILIGQHRVVLQVNRSNHFASALKAVPRLSTRARPLYMVSNRRLLARAVIIKIMLLIRSAAYVSSSELRD